MLLGARLLSGVSSVNAFDFVSTVEATQGEAFDVYLQLIDKQRHTQAQGYDPAGLRYMPASGATLTVQVLNLDASKQLTRVASQPYAQDDSIWKFSILATDPVKGTVNLKLTLTEGAVVRTAYLQAALSVSGDQVTC